MSPNVETLYLKSIKKPEPTRKEQILSVFSWIFLVKPLKLGFRALFGRGIGYLVVPGPSVSADEFLIKALQKARGGRALNDQDTYEVSQMRQKLEDGLRNTAFGASEQIQVKAIADVLLKLESNEPLSWKERRTLTLSKRRVSNLLTNAMLANEVTQHYADDQQVHRLRLMTSDNTEVDAVRITATKKQTSKLTIVHLFGNGACYQGFIDQMKDEASKLNATCIGLNFRGVGLTNERPRSKQDLINDAIAMVQHLIEKGTKPEDIVLSGHSLGAGIATYVAAHFHKMNQPVYLYNNRSFSNITKVALSFVRRLTQFVRYKSDIGFYLNGHESALGGKILAVLLLPFVKLAIAFGGWEINSTKAFLSIPEKYREYTVVKAPKGARFSESGELLQRDDIVISNYGSLHRSLKTWRKQIPKSSVDNNSVAYELKQARKMECGMNDGHNCEEVEIQSRSFKQDKYAVNGRQHFFSFVRAHHNMHGSTESERALENLYRQAAQAA